MLAKNLGVNHHPIKGGLKAKPSGRGIKPKKTFKFTVLLRYFPLPKFSYRKFYLPLSRRVI
jgi:hypothetical protein